MRENWYHLQGKFTSEEGKIIEDYLKKHKIPQNRLVRKSIGFLIPLERSKDRIKATNLIREFFQGIKKIVNSPDYKKRVDRLLVRLSKKYSPNTIEEFVKFFLDIDSDLKVFKKKHASRGRPKIERKRGRPKN